MKNSRMAIKLLDKDSSIPIIHIKITCHLVFDVKLDLIHKTRFVTGDHLTDPQTSLTYSSAVTRDSVRIGFLIAALNNVDVLAGDIQNAYLNAKTKEEIYFIAGDEWKANKDKIIVIVRALYGLKNSALQFLNHISDVEGNKVGFTSSLADPVVWYRSSTKPNGDAYYAYILVYIDVVLIIDSTPQKYMGMLKASDTVKPSSIGQSKTYLRADIGKCNTQMVLMLRQCDQIPMPRKLLTT